MAKQVRDIAASVRARLLALARHRNQQFDLVLTRYALERLLYRLSLTAYRERFVLKGAMLITTWFDEPHRPTRDVDLLGYGDPSPEPMLTVFREICAITADDGLTFDTNALRVDLIREELQYGGLRLRTTAALAGAQISVVIDIGFGDAVEPGVEEKFQAIVALGRANSRMKDFYDIWILSKTYEFADDRLAKAIVATFQRRNTAITMGVLDGLALNFAQDDAKRQQWAAFIKDLSGEVPPLATVIKDLAAFLIPKAREALALATNRE
jgi:predicted nucleotidyltransferase component of viral defense system